MVRRNRPTDSANDVGGQADVPQRSGQPGEGVEQGVRARGGRDDGAEQDEGDEVDGDLDGGRPAARPPLVGADQRGGDQGGDQAAGGAVPRDAGDELGQQGDAEERQRGHRAADGDDGDREHGQERELEARPVRGG